MKYFVLLVVSFLILLPDSVLAKKDTKKVYQATRTYDPPKIDGKINEPLWETGLWADSFTQHYPDDGASPSQDTEFKLLFDDNFIYVAIKAIDDSPDKIEDRLTKRDEVDGDFVGITFDSYHDFNTAFMFLISSSGVKGDEILYDGGKTLDMSWDPIWFVKTHKYSWGWAAEMKIPFTQLRFKKNSPEVWGLNVFRNIFRNDEFSFWQHVPKSSSGIVHHYGNLAGLGNIRPKKQLDIMPYVNAGMEKYEKEKGNPYATGSEFLPKAGLDAKIGITNNMTLDLTLNPDFGQIEADPSVINLTAFETFFEEKRPFFIEGQNITSFPLKTDNDNLFYSRRIGAKPHGYPILEEGQYADVPGNTTILGAAKLTGKTENGLSIGIIESITGKESASIFEDGQTKEEMVEPLTNYFVGSVSKEFNRGNSSLKGMVTNTLRKEDLNASFLLPKSATSAGLEFKQYFKNRLWMVNAIAQMSSLAGGEGAILSKQMASARYFQRPDADHIDVDSTIKTLNGHAGSLQAGKIGGPWTFLSFTAWKSPGFEINDIGYLNEADRIEQVFLTSYNFDKPFWKIRTLGLRALLISQWNHGGKFSAWASQYTVNTQFSNFYKLGMAFTIHADKTSFNHLRGGPSIILPAYKKLRLNLSSNDRKKVILGLSTEYRYGNENSYHRESLDLKLTVLPGSNLKLELNPFYSNNNKDYQYVATADFQANKRYILSEIAQYTFGLSFRLNFNITPDLSIQYWGQPFIATGDFKQFRYVTDSKAERYSDRFSIYATSQIIYDSESNLYLIDENEDGIADYNFRNPSFEIDEFLSNLVIRWEYIPGSALHVVWSQNRNYHSTSSEFNIAAGFDRLNKDSTPHNIFMAKLTHRFSLR